MTHTDLDYCNQRKFQHFSSIIQINTLIWSAVWQTTTVM